MKKKALMLLLAAAFAGSTMGAESCSESAEELDQSVDQLEDATGENDRRYKAKMRRVRLGMTKQEVRSIMGKPRDKQVFRSEFGRDDTWYYGTWQLSFSDNSLESKNRY